MKITVEHKSPLLPPESTNADDADAEEPTRYNSEELYRLTKDEEDLQNKLDEAFSLGGRFAHSPHRLDAKNKKPSFFSPRRFVRVSDATNRVSGKGASNALDFMREKSSLSKFVEDVATALRNPWLTGSGFYGRIAKLVDEMTFRALDGATQLLGVYARIAEDKELGPALLVAVLKGGNLCCVDALRMLVQSCPNVGVALVSSRRYREGIVRRQETSCTQESDDARPLSLLIATLLAQHPDNRRLLREAALNCRYRSKLYSAISTAIAELEADEASSSIPTAFHLFAAPLPEPFMFDECSNESHCSFVDLIRASEEDVEDVEDLIVHQEVACARVRDAERMFGDATDDDVKGSPFSKHVCDTDAPYHRSPHSFLSVLRLASDAGLSESRSIISKILRHGKRELLLPHVLQLYRDAGTGPVVRRLLHEDESLFAEVAQYVSQLHIYALCHDPAFGRDLMSRTKHFDGLIASLGTLEELCSPYAFSPMSVVDLAAALKLPTTVNHKKFDVSFANREVQVTLLEGCLLMLRCLSGRLRFKQGELRGVVGPDFWRLSTRQQEACEQLYGNHMQTVASTLTNVFSDVTNRRFIAQYGYRVNKWLEVCIDLVAALPTQGYDSPELLKPIKPGVETEVKDEDRATLAGTANDPELGRTPYGLAVDTFHRIHKSALDWEHSEVCVSLAGKEHTHARETAEMSFIKHTELLSKMEETDEVKRAFARLPHPKLCVSILFTLALVLLALASVAVFNSPHLAANTIVVEDRVANCLSDFQDDPQKLLSAVETAWQNFSSTLPANETAAMRTSLGSFGDCASSLTSAVLLYRSASLASQKLTLSFAEEKGAMRRHWGTPITHGDDDRLSFPRALYFSHIVEGNNGGQRYDVATEVVFDSNVKDRRFTHRIMPVFVTDPYIGVPHGIEWLSLLVVAALLMLAGMCFHIHEDYCFYKWCKNTPQRPPAMDLGRRALTIVVELVCFVFTVIAISGSFSLVRESPGGGPISWDAMEEFLRLATLVRVLMILCISPIAHGAGYCGSVVIWLGVPFLSSLLGLLWLMLSVLLNATTTTDLLLSVRLDTTSSTLLTAMVASMASSFAAQKTILLETKQFWVFYQKNYDLQLTNPARYLIGAALAVQVGAVAASVVFTFWSHLFLRVPTERLDILNADGTEVMGVVESVVALAVPLGALGMNVLTRF